MKKIVIVIAFCILLTGCASIPFSGRSENAEKNTAGQEWKPYNHPTPSPSYNELEFADPEKGYEAYAPYLMSAGSNSVSGIYPSNISVIQTTRRIVESSGTADFMFEFGDYKSRAVYAWTEIEIGTRATPTRRYYTDYGDIFTDAETGQIVECNFKISNLIDQNPQIAPLSQPECKKIAMVYLESFGFVPDSSYTLSESELRTINAKGDAVHQYYHFLFTRMMNGVPTSDTCSVGVTVYGSLLVYNRGDQFDDEAFTEDIIDDSRINEITTKYGVEKCEMSDGLYRFENVKIVKIIKLDKSTYGIWCGARYWEKYFDSDQLSSDSIIIPI